MITRLSFRNHQVLNDVLYFQPNGSSCYLYKRRQDIGKTSLAKYRPARGCIRKPTEYDLATKVVATPSYESPQDPFDMLYRRILEEEKKKESKTS